MCGIFGVLQTKTNAPQMVFSGLKDIEYRGYDSWGVAYFNNNKLLVQKQTGFLPAKIETPDASISIGHTRWATHGGVTKENAHPHTDCTKKIALVHNGIVENFQELKKKLISHVFRSQTDTEVVAHLIEENLKKEKDLFSAAKKVFKLTEGLNAFVVTNGKEIIAFKKGSPMVLGKTEGGFCLASDPNALINYTKELYFVEDNELIHIKNNSKVELFDMTSNKKQDLTFKKISWEYQHSELQKYDHFLQKEIYEQPANIKKLSSPNEDIKKTASLIKNAFGTYFIGCGTASYACLVGTYLFSKFAKRHVNFSIGSEFTYLQDFISPKSLLIAVSQSGETIDVIEPVQLTKSKKAKVVAITNVEGSTLFRLADSKIMLQSGVEKAVLGTKSFTAMVSIMIRLAFEIAGNSKTGAEILEKSSIEVQKVIAQESKIKELAEKIKKSKNIFILGRGLSYPIALEAALKIKEASYIHAEGFAAGELKHGVIALIEKGTPVIVFAPNDETKQAVLSNAMEVKARGALVIGVSPETNDIFDFHIPVADVGASSILPNVVFAQLLAYHLTLKLGKNPDKPRNLAKSVVVR